MQDVSYMEAQLRECYARVCWSHKTHEKQADIYRDKDTALTWGKIIVTALAATGGIASLLANSYWNILSSFFATILLLINLVFENRNYANLLNAHRNTATQLWVIRESYLSLLTDLHSSDHNIEQIIETRNKLQNDLAAIFESAPRTYNKAYAQATKALHGSDLNFSDDEIDRLLPSALRKGNL